MLRIVLLAAFLAVRGLTACSPEFDPAASARYYNSEGWHLPGIADSTPSAPIHHLGQYAVAKVPGARAVVLPHYEDPYIVEFPAQLFTLNGTSKRMRPILALAAILRWEMKEKVFAYSYGLVPVSAHRIDRKWKIDSEVGCMFDETFIDENGDGVFRLLVPGVLTESVVPAWVKRPQAD